MTITLIIKNTKCELKPEFAWKNLRYWWENKHYNPDNNPTSWQPKSKKIWFTEFGFPSIDKASNQPNIFFDPLCVDGGVPKHSSGESDFAIQRRAISAFIEYWQSQKYIAQMFLWTWDARPYPAWPHMNIWSDGNLWEKGHWVNDKFGSSSVASIIAEISSRCGIDTNRIEASSIDETVEGIIFNNPITAINAINILRAAYLFDIIACYKDKITFVKRGYNRPISIKSEELVKLSDNSFIKQIEIPQQLILSKIDMYFIDRNKNYDTSYCHINNENHSFKSNLTIRLPMVLTNHEVKRIGQMILENAATENRVIHFKLSILAINLQAGDL